MDEKIGLSKYEGHQPAPWRWVKPTDMEEWFLYAERGNHSNLNYQKGGGIWLPDTFCRLGKGLDPTHRDVKSTYDLIADAPLLLSEVKRLEALVRSKGLCTNCGQSHEGIEVVMDYSEDEVGHRISKECVGTCHPNLSVHCCDLCLCLNGFTIEHDYWEAKKNE